MDSKHIERDYSAHRKSVIRPYDEYIRLEIFSYDPQLTKTYLSEDDTLKGSSNCTKTSWKRWSCFKSTNKQDAMQFNIKYNSYESGDYRIDLIYEQNDYIHDGKTNTSDDLIGSITINDTESDVLFDGENNILKRQIIYHRFDVGSQDISFKVPHNCYFYGVIIRKIVKYVGDNYYGSSLGSEEGNMVLTSATLTISNMTKPSELSCTVFYDDAFECMDSPSGFYIDYHDEVNFYVKSDDGEIKQVFGGYVSSILPNADRTQLTIACADRLVDGQNKYVLDEMTLGGGATDLKESGYDESLSKNFDSYPKALEYLCNIHEVTLKSNISKAYTVDGEKFHDGFVLTYGSSKNIKNIPVSNAISKPSKNHILVRNKPSSEQKQIWTLYDASKYAKKPVEITNYPYLHITYGIANPKTETKTKVSETVDNSDTSAGSQKFNKCGVSQDGKYIMAIGKKSAKRDSDTHKFTKAIFERKCPHCNSDKLYWGYMWSGNFPCTHRFNNGSAGRHEGHIYCDGCDADYSVQGWEHINKSTKRLTVASSVVASTEEEAYKLARGEMVAVPSTNVSITADDVFQAITKIAFQYSYRRNGGSSNYSTMKKRKYGDCWAFADLVFTELKKYKVSCKIVEYSTNASSNHRSVLYLDKNNKWADFPYKTYGWNTKYNNMLNATSGSKNGRTVEEYKGNNIATVKAITNNTQNQTTTITNTKGYDKDKPFQAFLRIIYSISTNNTIPTFKSKTYNLDVKFTQNATTSYSLNDWTMPLYWVNNTIKQTTLKKGKYTIIDYLKSIHGENTRIFLQGLKFIAPTREATKENEDVDWYKFDDSTNDDSSCKLNLYQITFDDNPSVEPSDLKSCGKSVNSTIQDIVKEAGYYVDMTYGLHRKDDQINFRVVNQDSEQYTATEGDDNNILSWNSISYSPIGSLYNMSMQVFKQNDGKYKYIDTADSLSILKYGEQCTLQTSNNSIEVREAYFNATTNEKYNPSQTYTFTITVPNLPNVKIGDLVKVIADAKKLNTIKEVKSVKVVFDTSKIPRIQTTIGLDELAPDIQLKENIRELRRTTKTESTVFSSSATPVSSEIYYEWDK